MPLFRSKPFGCLQKITIFASENPPTAVINK